MKYGIGDVYFMIRRFLPVGQGAFYVEQFCSDRKKINVVYDCGSMSKVCSINDEIKSVFKKDEEIEIVFISHVDQDHINGLEYLLKYCNVKNVVFPYIRETEKWAFGIEYFCNADKPSKDDFAYRFIDNPFVVQAVSNHQTRLYQVLEAENNRTDPENNNNFPINDNNILVIESGRNAVEIIFGKEEAERIKWEYIPFNFREKNRTSEFREKLYSVFTEAGIPLHDYERLIEEWGNLNVRKAIINAYKQVKGSLNSNSMVLFSGIKEKSIIQWKTCLNCNGCTCDCFYCFNCCAKANGCLYTGDYEAKGNQKWKDLKNAYAEYWEYIGCVQIPHHGSSHNYNKEFEKMKAYFVISAGRNNKYKHPHKQVIEGLRMSNKHPFIVTEQPDSELRFLINIF